MDNYKPKKMKTRLKYFFLISVGFFIGLSAIVLQPKTIANVLQLDEQAATVLAINKVSPAVVNIDLFADQVVTKQDELTGQSKSEKQTKKVGSGTGFLVSADGLILTNKHVIQVDNPSAASYRVTLHSGKKYYAQLIGNDPLNDLAVIKIFDKKLPFVELGDSDKLTAGLSVIAIGNALGIYQNSVTKGIVSGLNRDIVASDQSGNAENLGNIIQTDAEINVGNSGGPLVDLNGKVVGVNVATDLSGASIGFAIPINDARPVIQSVLKSGRIIRPRLGIRYLTLTPEIAKENKLARDSGAWLNTSETGESPITPGSPAEKAGLKTGDIIFEINGKALSEANTLISSTQKLKPGDSIKLKVFRDDKVIILQAILDEFMINLRS